MVLSGISRVPPPLVLEGFGPQSGVGFASGGGKTQYIQFLATWLAWAASPPRLGTSPPPKSQLPKKQQRITPPPPGAKTTPYESSKKDKNQRGGVLCGWRNPIDHDFAIRRVPPSLVLNCFGPGIGPHFVSGGSAAHYCLFSSTWWPWNRPCLPMPGNAFCSF